MFLGSLGQNQRLRVLRLNRCTKSSYGLFDTLSVFLDQGKTFTHLSYLSFLLGFLVTSLSVIQCLPGLVVLARPPEGVETFKELMTCYVS